MRQATLQSGQFIGVKNLTCFLVPHLAICTAACKLTTQHCQHMYLPLQTLQLEKVIAVNNNHTSETRVELNSLQNLFHPDEAKPYINSCPSKPTLYHYLACYHFINCTVLLTLHTKIYKPKANKCTFINYIHALIDKQSLHYSIRSKPIMHRVAYLTTDKTS